MKDVKKGDKVRCEWLASVNKLDTDIFTVTGLGEKKGELIAHLTHDETGAFNFEYVDEIDEIVESAPVKIRVSGFDDVEVGPITARMIPKKYPRK
jgi:hypothetical protein